MAILIPYTFTANTDILSTEVNANFTALTNALDKRGDTLTGNLTVSGGVTIDGVDISAVIGAGGTLLAVNGSAVTNLNASNLASGTIPDARFPSTLPALNGSNLTALVASNLSTGTVPTARLGSGTANSGSVLRGDSSWVAIASLSTVQFAEPKGRLTLTTGTPVTTADVSAATTLYYTPYKGNTVRLYSGSVWNEYTFTELSISLAGKTASTPYDVFLYDNSGTPALELLAWTNSTTRATALTTQDGAYVKSGATTRLYLGTIYINATGGQTDDTLAKRYLWNMYHRIEATLRRLETTDNWTYSTGTFRQANASTANQIELVAGLLEDTISLTVAAVMTENNARMGYVGVGEDSTTTPSASSIGRVGNAGEQSSANRTAVMSTFASRPSSVGYHYYAWLEAGWGTGTNTWYGDDGASVTQSGITGSWRY